MSDFNRRSVLKASLGGAALLAGPGIVPVRAAEWTNVPEPNASIRVLRWKQFIQAEFDKFAEQTKKFSEKTGIKVKLEAESWEDIRPKPLSPPMSAPVRTSSLARSMPPTNSLKS